MSDGSSIFAGLISEQPKKERPSEPEIPRGPKLQPVVPPTDVKSPPIEKLLDWLVNRWPGDTVKTVNILQYGPRGTRSPKAAKASAEILVERGWLTPLKTRRYIDREWKIERGLKSD
jgi:hypothetical protein